MPEFEFPESRFLEAGATAAEVSQLKREFNGSDVGIQRAQTEFWAGGPTSYLAEYLFGLRSQGHLTPAATESATDGDSSGSTASDVLTTTEVGEGESDAPDAEQ